MKSPLTLQKICECCNKEFSALKANTRFCSTKCNSKFYKLQTRKTQIEAINKQTQAIKEKPLADIKARDYLTVMQVATLLGCTKQTVYKIIRSGKLNAVNLLQKKTVVRRCDIDKLFTVPNAKRSSQIEPPAVKPVKQPDTPPATKPFRYALKNCYNLKEVMEIYGVSESSLYTAMRRYNIPKFRQGRFSYVPKELIDKIFMNDTNTDNQNK